MTQPKVGDIVKATMPFKRNGAYVVTSVQVTEVNENSSLSVTFIFESEDTGLSSVIEGILFEGPVGTPNTWHSLASLN